MLGLCEQYAKEPHRTGLASLWRQMHAARLDAVEQDQVLRRLVDLDVGKKRPLTTEWQAFLKAQRKRDADSAKIERREKTGKVLIEVNQGEEATTTEIERVLVEAKDPELPLMRNGNGYVRPVSDQPEWGKSREGQPVPTIAMLAQHTESSLRWAIERHIELACDGTEVAAGEYATRLLQNPLPRAPRVEGLITHPLVRADGRLIDLPGLDEESGIYLHLGGRLGFAPPFIKPPLAIPDDPAAARQLATQFAQELLADYDDYRFEHREIDAAVALSSRASILTRKDLTLAPCYLLVGPERGSGKTTLAAIDHVIATGHDIPAAYLEEDSEKSKQTLFATFISSPAGVLFDNLPANDAFGSDVLAQALTKGFVETRKFHSQTNLRANTNTLIYFTGNSITLNEDLQARTLEVRFAAERPTKWTHPDWLAHARLIREDVRTKLQFIQRAFIRHGKGTVQGVYTRFTDWNQRVRDPLLWAGLPDIGKRFQTLEDQNPNRLADAGILAELAGCFQRPFTAGEVAVTFGADHESTRPAFRALRLMLQERWPKALSKNGPQALGQYFKEHLKRWLRVDEARSLRLTDTSAKGRTNWKVEVKQHGDDLDVSQTVFKPTQPSPRQPPRATHVKTLPKTEAECVEEKRLMDAFIASFEGSEGYGPPAG